MQEYLQRPPNARKNLAGWAYTRTRQNDKLKKYLLECGIYYATDWSILNGMKIRQLKEVLEKQFTPTEIQKYCHILDIYHKVYREDRRRVGANNKCHPPNQNQQQRMIDDLQATYQLTYSGKKLLKELQAIAKICRDDKTSNLENRYKPYLDDLTENSDAAEDDQDWLWLKEKVIIFLDQAIPEQFELMIKEFRKHKCASLPLIRAFRLQLCEGMNQSQAASQLGITQSQISRQINRNYCKLSEGVMEQVKNQIVQYLLSRRTDSDQENRHSTDVIENIIAAVKEYLNKSVFTVDKIGDARTRKTNDLYLERLCIYLKQCKEQNYE